MDCAQCKQPLLAEDKRASTRGIGAFYHEKCWDDHPEWPDDNDCTYCGGEGWQESDDPLWDGADEVPCRACGGSGERRHQSVF